MKPLPVVLNLLVLFFASGVRAEPTCTPLTRENVGPCAVVASRSVRASTLATAVRRAEVERTHIVLPSNPILAITFAGRRTSEDSALNASVQLAQEIELGGQRGARGREAEARVGASEANRSAVARAVAADALMTYFEVLATREELDLLRRAEVLATRVAEVARAQARVGAGSELDAEVAEAQSARRAQARMSTEGRAAAAVVRLSRLVGIPVVLAGKLEPLGAPTHQQSIPQAVALEKEALALDAQASVLNRSRLPNVTLSLFAQSDGFRERVLGAGLAVPIPLPEPLGRSRASDINVVRTEAEATRAEAEATRAEAIRQADAQQVETEALLRAASRVDDARAAQAEETLSKLADEVERGRLQARDAFVAQDILTDTLVQRIDAKRQACVASVRLAALRGEPLERGLR